MLLLLVLVLVLFLFSTLPSSPFYFGLLPLSFSLVVSNGNISHSIVHSKKQAGYYIDSSKDPSRSNVLLMVGVNYSYRDFLHNFKCWMDKIGVKFLPVALDPEIYKYIRDFDIAPTFLMPQVEVELS